MSKIVLINKNFFPGHPVVKLLFPDHWEPYREHTPEHQQFWGDYTFSLVHYRPMVSYTLITPPQEEQPSQDPVLNEWSETETSLTYIEAASIEAVTFQKDFWFKDITEQYHYGILTGAVAVIDPTRTWEVEEIIKSARVY